MSSLLWKAYGLQRKYSLGLRLQFIIWKIKGFDKVAFVIHLCDPFVKNLSSSGVPILFSYKVLSFLGFFKNSYLFEGEREERRERNIDCCSTYGCSHWFILVCALTGDQTHNLGVLGWHSNQLSYLARAPGCWLKVLAAISHFTNLSLFLSHLSHSKAGYLTLHSETASCTQYSHSANQLSITWRLIIVFCGLFMMLFFFLCWTIKLLWELEGR